MATLERTKWVRPILNYVDRLGFETAVILGGMVGFILFALGNEGTRFLVGVPSLLLFGVTVVVASSVATASVAFLVRPPKAPSVAVDPIERERYREIGTSLGVGAFLVSVLLFSAWTQFQSLQNGYRYAQLQRELAEEEEIRRRMRLQVQTLSSPARIERVARERLRMTAPSFSDAVLVEGEYPLSGVGPNKR